MKQVLIFDTAIATTNLGDEIIMCGCRKGLSGLLNESLCFRLGTHIENFPAYKTFNNWRIKNLCGNSDYKFIFGTNIIAGRFSLTGSRQWKINLFNRIIYKDVILVGVGRMGDFKKMSGYTKYLYKSILSKEYIHSVRDEETKKALESIGVKAINTGCPTLWEFTPEKCKKIPTRKAEKCVVSVSGYGGQTDRKADQEMINILKRNYTKLYIWIQTAVDEKYFNSLENTKDFEYIYSLEKFGALLDEGNIDYIGTRLHGGIFALQHNCRTLIISIDERARGFHETNNIPILERKEINKLNTIINSTIKTDIRVNREEINQFISQFY